MDTAESGTPRCHGCVYSADGLVTVACVHEHIVREWHCEARIAAMRRSAGYIACSACVSSGVPAGGFLPEVTVGYPDGGSAEVIQEAGEALPDEARRRLLRGED